MTPLKQALALIPPGKELKELSYLTRFAIEAASWLRSELAIYTDEPGALQAKGFLSAESETPRRSVAIFSSFDGSARSFAQILASARPWIVILPDADEALLARIRVPILVPPKAPVLAEHHWIARRIARLVVPLNTENRSSRALEFALNVANQTETPVHLIHVTKTGDNCACGISRLETLPDQVQHEYPHILERILAESSPFSHRHERRWVRELCHCSGDLSSEILNYARKTPQSAIVLEWDEHLGEAHRQILQRASGPVFLVRKRARFHSQLKVPGRGKAA